MHSSFGTNFTVHWRYTETLWTASPVMRKFPEWQFPLGFCKETVSTGDGCIPSSVKLQCGPVPKEKVTTSHL